MPINLTSPTRVAVRGITQTLCAADVGRRSPVLEPTVSLQFLPPSAPGKTKLC